MKIFYEDSLLYASEFFDDLGDCQSFSHKQIDAEQLKDADVLLVRSTTKVDQALLSENSRLCFVGTATAGTDHIDREYLKQRGIPFTSAVGCNATAVAEYVISAIFAFAEEKQWLLSDKTVGIVGAGQVGTVLANKLKALDIQYKLCDPPLLESGDTRFMVSMDEIMQCDIITLHVPLVTSGKYPTQHLFDLSRLSALRADQLLINSCRGEVLDNAAALSLFEQGSSLNLVLDVWENEPDINLKLVPHIFYASAHIAGHSIEGKSRGTEILYQRLCQFLHLPVNKRLDDFLPAPVKPTLTCFETTIGLSDIAKLVFEVYDVRKDDADFQTTIHKPDQFRYIRKHYAIRREFAAIQVNTGNSHGSERIYRLGFKR